MVYLNDDCLDNGLAYITANGGQMDICSQEPTNYTEATSTYSLGNKVGPTIGAPTDGDVNGRKVVISAITDGSVTATGTATHWALSKTTATAALLATQSLTASQAVTLGNTFSLTEIDITYPDPS